MIEKEKLRTGIMYWNRLRQWAHSIERRVAQKLESLLAAIERQGEFEKTTVAILMLFAAMLSDLLIGLHPAYRHVLYLPIWFGAWFLDRRIAAWIAVAASIWVWVAPYFGGQTMGLAMTTGTIVAIVMFNFGGWIISRLRTVYQREKLRARVDALTGCLNTLGFYEEADEMIELMREDFRPFAFLYADLDDFKKMNDTRGHLEADKALKLLGRQLKLHTRTHDVVGRVGGDEFVVMLVGIGPDMAFAAAERLQRKIQVELQRRGFPVTLSVGCLAFNEAPESVQVAVQMADQIMYSAKNGGKARVVRGVWPPHESVTPSKLAAIYAN